MAHIVKCRVCGNKFDAVEDEINKVWIMPSRNYYYHKDCYETWKQKDTPKEEADWELLIYDLLARDLQVKYNYHMIESQRKKFISQKNFTNKGIYYALYWHHIIRKQPWKEEYGIGIIANIYYNAANFWVGTESRSKGIVKQIENFAMEKRATYVIDAKKRQSRSSARQAILPTD